MVFSSHPGEERKTENSPSPCSQELCAHAHTLCPAGTWDVLFLLLVQTFSSLEIHTAAHLTQFLKRNMPAKAWQVPRHSLGLYLGPPRTYRQASLHVSTQCIPVLLPSHCPDRPAPAGLSDLNSASLSQQVPSTLINLTIAPTSQEPP